jgi:hypothetical protein
MRIGQKKLIYMFNINRNTSSASTHLSISNDAESWNESVVVYITIIKVIANYSTIIVPITPVTHANTTSSSQDPAR